jgi:hypothetical protein
MTTTHPQFIEVTNPDDKNRKGLLAVSSITEIWPADEGGVLISFVHSPDQWGTLLASNDYDDIKERFGLGSLGRRPA